jgi:hypothetical protein
MWCWVAEEEAMITACYYTLCWLIIILNCYFVCRLVCLLKKELKNDLDLVDKYINKLKWFPLVQIISLLPASIARLHWLISGEPNFYLILCQSVFDALTGLMFSLVYGFNPTVRVALSELCQKITGTYKPRKESYDTFNNRSRNISLIDESFVSKKKGSEYSNNI